MHDHEFERQVHQKMEGLHLEPSDALWERVEGQLHKKKRRRILFWIPLLLAGLFTGGYILQYDFQPISTATLSSDPVLGNNKKAQGGRTETTVNPLKESSTTPSSSSRQTDRTLDNGKNKKQDAALNNTPHPSPVYTPYKKNRQTGENTYAAISSKQQGMATTNASIEERNLLSSIGTSINQTDSLAFDEPVAAVVPPVFYSHEPFHTLFISPSGKDRAIQTVSLSNKKRLHWGIHAAIIKTSINDGRLGKLFSYNSMADQAMANQSIPGNTSSGNLTGSKPSVVQAGTGFSAGFFLRKEIGSRWAISTGLDYTLYRTSITIGRSRDSLLGQFSFSGADRYFLTGNGSYSRSYTNNYHFIGLPLLLQFQLTKGKLPIVWEGGVELARLLSSNALHYSSTLNGYYKNNHLLNHTQFYVLTGLQLKAFSNARYPVNIGPQLQVGLTNLSTSSAGKQEHLTRYGLRISTVIK